MARKYNRPLGDSLESSTEYKKAIKLRKRLLQRFERIKKQGLPSSAYAKYQQKEYGKFDFKNIQDIKNRINDLGYLLGLHSSTIRGARSFKENWESIQNKMDIDPSFKYKFWDLYGKAVEEYGLAQTYKYTTFSEIEKNLDNNNLDEEEIIKNVINAVNSSDFSKSKVKKEEYYDYYKGEAFRQGFRMKKKPKRR